MSPRLALEPADGAATTGLFGSAYLAACALHEPVTPAAISAAGVRLPVLVAANGALSTPYGYPQPEGDGPLEALRDAALGCRRPWRAALAPIGRGAGLAALLAEDIAPVSSRPIVIHDFDGAGDAVDRFAPAARSMVRRAERAEVRVVAGPVTAAFGALYRAAMDALGADPLYRFGDAYLQALNAAGGRQLLLHDAAGVAAGALFLVGAPESSYHLSARRAAPPPPPGAANLLIAEGLRRCRAAGAAYCYLGGGLATAADDPLLAFKRTMATRVVDRPTFRHPGVA